MENPPFESMYFPLNMVDFSASHAISPECSCNELEEGARGEGCVFFPENKNLVKVTQHPGF